MRNLLLHSGNVSPEVLIVIFLVFITIAIIYTYFSKRAVVLRNLEKAKEKKIINYTDGEKGKITGKIIFAGETLNAPLTGRKCSYYYVLVEEYRSGGKSGSWHKVIEDEKKGDVVLFDETGYAIIDTRFSMCYLVPDAKFESGSLNEPTKVLSDYLASKNIDETGFFGFNKKLRYSEGILEQDELCAVSGEGQWNLAKDHGVNIPSEHILVFTSNNPDHEKVYLSDDPMATGMDEN